MNHPISGIISFQIDENDLWNGRYKIPWDEPGFSARMLREHLSQEHDLASRRTEIITAQVDWIHRKIAEGVPNRLLDLGCGPGLYLERFLHLGYECTGIDFSPASIEYASNRLSGKVKLVREDLRVADFGEGHDLAMMLFGELNVFSPDECARILSRAHQALTPGGTLILEVHTFDVVKRSGLAPNTWYRSDGGLHGLFSDRPHLCLIENHWMESHRTAMQIFQIVESETDRVETFRNTIRAWTNDDYRSLLNEAGFRSIRRRTGWPSHNRDFMLFTAIKPS